VITGRQTLEYDEATVEVEDERRYDVMIVLARTVVLSKEVS
jgi:hypothetical protein